MTDVQTTTTGTGDDVTASYDAVIVGAGFAGLYMLHKLRGLGFSARVYDAAGGVGGTWYWNRYPGARCDVQSLDYSFSFDPELEQEWEWTEKYSTQPEILRYANHVADRYDLWPDMQFDTRIEDAQFDEGAGRWIVRTDQGDVVSAQHVVMAVGHACPRRSCPRRRASRPTKATPTRRRSGRTRVSTSPASGWR